MSPKRHTLKGEAFQLALERYVDDNKPDPIVLKQIEGFELSWAGASNEEEEESNDDSSKKLGCPSDLSFTPTDIVQGVLTWKGDYMCAEIEALCCWEPHSKNKSSSRKDGAHKLPLNGSLYFVLRSSLRFRNKHDKPAGDDGDESKSKEEKKAGEKIRSRMIKRLKEDSFIKKLLPDDSKNNKESSIATILCEAKVSVKTPDNDTSPSQFEERVDVTDSIGEGLRRALFSSAESSLDVAELLLSLPFLPGAAHQVLNCPLADRAKLRLLEDAMFDACEREGEDDLIGDLKISSKADEETKPNQSSQSKQSSKRTKR